MPLGLNDVTWESIRPMVSDESLPSWLRSSPYRAYSMRDRGISLRSENGEPIRMASETSPYMRLDDFIRDESVFVGLSNNQGEEFRVPMRELLHEEAQEYRAQGGEEDSEYIRQLQGQWQDLNRQQGGDASVAWAQVVERLRRHRAHGDYHEASASANLEFDEEDDYASELEVSDELDAYLSGIRVIEARKD